MQAHSAENIDKPGVRASAAPEAGARERIISAAFAAFVENGYAATSTLDIARRAKVSKRDLYAHFGGKHAILVACINSRANRMRLPPDLPTPTSREMLATTLRAFAANLVRETSHPAVVATFRLAIAEAKRSPELAAALEQGGRGAARGALTELIAQARTRGLIDVGEPSELAAQFFGLLWEGLMVALLLGVAAAPTPAEAEERANKATAAFLQLHPAPPPVGSS